MKKIKHGWRIYIDDGGWLSDIITEPETRIILLRIGNYRLVLEKPGTDTVLEQGIDY